MNEKKGNAIAGIGNYSSFCLFGMRYTPLSVTGKHVNESHRK